MSYETELAISASILVREYGFSVIPGSEKTPMTQWKEFQERRPSMTELASWDRMDAIFVVTGAISNICVIDCDSRENAEWWYHHRPRTPMMVKTKRGVHFYYRHPGERVMNGAHILDRYDVRGDGGYVVAPPSRHSEGKYTFVGKPIPSGELPVFDPSWRPPTDLAKMDKEIADGLAYIRTILAKSGANGHADTFRAACCLRDSGLCELEAYAALSEWNKTNAEPPWPEVDLLHKIRDAFQS